MFLKRVPGAHVQGSPGTSATTKGTGSTVQPLGFPLRLQPDLLCARPIKVLLIKGLAEHFY
jgi:hypothetical protein